MALDDAQSTSSRRELSSCPATVHVSLISSPGERGDDLDLIALVDVDSLPLGARDDPSIQPHGDALGITAGNGGRPVAPLLAGDTVYAWSEVLETMPLPGRDDIGALRLRTVATKDHACADYPYKNADGADHPAVVLDLDYTALMPRRPTGEDRK